MESTKKSSVSSVGILTSKFDLPESVKIGEIISFNIQLVIAVRKDRLWTPAVHT